MRADRAAVMERLRAARLNAWKTGITGLAQSKFARNHLFREIAFADEKRHDENARRKDATQDASNTRLQFPKCFDDLPKDATAAQFIRVLIRRRCRIGV